MKIPIFLFLFLITLASSVAQDVKINVECGDITESSFTKNGETQDLIIYLSSGDNLKINSYSKYGDHLTYAYNFLDPAGNLLFDRTRSASYYKSKHIVETGPVPATGKYIFQPKTHNRVGDYVNEFVCEKANGSIISPSNKNTPSQASIKPAKTQFISIPFGTPIEGDITPGSNQLYGFKTKISRGTQANLQITITQGNAPLNIQIIDPSNESVVFSTSTGYSKSMQSTITFPSTQEYLISIKESPSSQGGSLTKFRLSLE